MEQLIAITALSVLGALSRYGVDQLVHRFSNTPGVSTLIVNVTGSLFAGIIVALAGRHIVTQQMQIAILVGFCGSFTTFSAYAIQTIVNMERGNLAWTTSFFVLNPILALLAAYVGLSLTKNYLG